MTERERRRRTIEHLRAGEVDEAAGEMAGSREPYPGDGTIHHAIALAFASRGTLGPALEQLEAAVKLDPKSPAILTDLAQVHLAQGDAGQAVEMAEQAVELAPELAIARFTLGRASFVAECARQARRPPAPEPGNHFALVDGRSPTYLRAVTEMEAALGASPPFATAVRGVLALAYERAGHYHAGAEQLRAQVAELPAGEEAEQAQARLVEVEHEIVREDYWAMEEADLPAIEQAAAAPEAAPETKLRLAHAYAAMGREEALRRALAAAREAGYEPRDASIGRTSRESSLYPAVADGHMLIAGGLECIIDGGLRFLPFRSLRSVSLGQPRLWREGSVELVSGERLECLVPVLYRFSLRSPSDLIQTGRFTQFSYGPGESRWAYVIGSRSLSSDAGVIPFAEVESLAF